MRLTTILLVSCLILASCSTVSVSRDIAEKPGKTESVPGIPFYVKALKTRQETKWSEVTHNVEVIVAATDKDGKSLPRSSWTSPTANTSEALLHGVEMTALRKAVSQFSARPTLPKEDVQAAIRGLSQKFEALRLKAITEQAARAARPNGLPSTTDVKLVSNRLIEEIVVDTKIKYYANGRHPPMGTGKANFELSKDMTLTKVESEVSDETLKTFLDLLPVEEFFTKQWALTGEADAAGDPTPSGITISVSLKVTPQTTIYTLSKSSEGVGAPIPITDATKAGTSFEVGVVKPSGGGDKKTDDKNTLKVDATVKLPSASSDKKK